MITARDGNKTEAALGGGLGAAGGSVLGNKVGGSTGSTIGAGLGGAAGGALANEYAGGSERDRGHRGFFFVGGRLQARQPVT